MAIYYSLVLFMLKKAIRSKKGSMRTQILKRLSLELQDDGVDVLIKSKCVTLPESALLKILKIFPIVYYLTYKLYIRIARH